MFDSSMDQVFAPVERSDVGMRVGPPDRYVVQLSGQKVTRAVKSSWRRNKGFIVERVMLNHGRKLTYVGVLGRRQSPVGTLGPPQSEL